MSISKSLLVIGAFLLVSLPAFAQFGQVDGYVLGPDKKPILGAVIAFDRLDMKDHTETKTDKKGYYQIAALRAGDYSITVTVDGQFREKRDYYHVSPGRQDATMGNSALGLTFNLKPVAVVQAQQQKEAIKEGNAGTDEEKAKARENQEASRKALMDSYGQGKEALDNKKYDEAIASLTKASTLDPKQTAVWTSLAQAYVGLAQSQKSAEASATLQKADEAFNKAIELAPSDAGNYNNYALALAAGGKVDEAKEKLAKAIEIDPTGAGKYHYNLGAFLMNAGKSDDATEEFRKGIQADPNYAESYFYLGSMLAGKSTTDPSGKMVPPAGTIDALQKYLQLKPDGPNAPAAKDLIAALGSKVDVDFKDPNAKKKK
jgi:tetratricopeptide (TPR) repeat protein